MSVVLPGNSTANKLATASTISLSGVTKVAFYVRFRVLATQSTYPSIFSTSAYLYGGGRLDLSNNNIAIYHRTTTEDGFGVSGFGPTVGTSYEVWCTIDFATNTKKFYVGTTLVNTITLAGGSGIYNGVDYQPFILGDDTDGKDYVIEECAIWKTNIPSASDITTRTPGTTVRNMSVPPVWGMDAQEGTNGAYALTVEDYIGTNNLVQSAGPTTGANAPVFIDVTTPVLEVTGITSGVLRPGSVAVVSFTNPADDVTLSTTAGAITVSSQDSTSATFVVPNPTVFGDKSLNFSSNDDTITNNITLSVNDGTTTDTITFQINPPLQWEFAEIESIDPLGIYYDDVDVEVGDFAVSRITSGDTNAVIDLTDGTWAINQDTTIEYALFRTAGVWSNFAEEILRVPQLTNSNPVKGSIITYPKTSIKQNIITQVRR